MFELLVRIEAHACAVAARTSEIVEVGPFSALFGPGEEPWLSWAAPRGSLGAPDELREPLAELARAFASRGRLLRVEYCAALHPQLPKALVAAGLAPEAEVPLFGCVAESFRPRPHRDVRVRWVGAGDDAAFLGSLMKRGFEAPGKIEPEEIERIRAGLAAGTRYAIAEHTGLPAASGCSSPDGTVTEIAAVSTLPTMRRRGAAAALVSFLVAAHLEEAAGRAEPALAWCTAGDDAAYGLFSSLGFADLGVRASFTADPAARPD